MVVLSIMSLLIQLRDGIEAKIAHCIQIAFSASIALVTSIIVLASLDKIFVWTSPVIQIGFILALWFNLCSLFEIQIRMRLIQFIKTLRTLLFLMTLICPPIYVAQLVSESKLDAAKAIFSDKNWFIRIDESQFPLFVTIASILLFAIYSLILVLSVKIGKHSRAANVHLDRNL